MSSTSYGLAGWLAGLTSTFTLKVISCQSLSKSINEKKSRRRSGVEVRGKENMEKEERKPRKYHGKRSGQTDGS